MTRQPKQVIAFSAHAMNAMAEAYGQVKQYSQQSKGERKTHCIKCGGEIGLRVGVQPCATEKLIPFYMAEPHEIMKLGTPGR
jgi:hypothetical protein